VEFQGKGFVIFYLKRRNFPTIFGGGGGLVTNHVISCKCMENFWGGR